MVKKVVAFLKEWDTGVILYARNWKLNHFNRVNYETFRMLHEKLLTELKKKATKVCETQNVTLSHMIQEGNMSQLWDTD